MRSQLRPTALVALLMLGALIEVSVAPVDAHHSFAAEFDASKPVTLTGTVTQIDWANPHVWFYLNVKDEEGRMVRWACEMGAPHQLQQRGWLRDTMKVGDLVTMAGSLARDGARRANARTVTTADGKTLGAASSGDPTTTRQ
jgi:Family of unknown function (DUF6152)